MTKGENMSLHSFLNSEKEQCVPWIAECHRFTPTQRAFRTKHYFVRSNTKGQHQYVLALRVDTEIIKQKSIV